MFRLATLVVASALEAASCAADSAPRNQVLGTWRMKSARIEHGATSVPAYGIRPSGMLVFAADMHYVEVLTDGDVPPFASEVRGRGTVEENRTAMASSIGMFGTYTVDEGGEFSGNRVEGSTFPNWIGDTRTRRDLRMTVDGNRMTEQFQRPDGTRIAIEFERVRD